MLLLVLFQPVKHEHVAADDDAQGQESVAKDEVERHEDGEAEHGVSDVVGDNHDDAGHGDVEDAQEAVDDDQFVQELQLETKVIRMFPKISQSRRRPLLGPSPG